MEQAFVQVYTGEGKGKTTAALGLAVRATCSGMKVIMLQFLKGVDYSELKAPQCLPNFTIEQHGGGCLVGKEAAREDRVLAATGLARLGQVVSSGEYGMVIADELNVALSMNLFQTDEVLEVIGTRNPHTELIITGRYAPREIIDLADLVTVMTEVKHYYHNGVMAREGIEK